MRPTTPCQCCGRAGRSGHAAGLGQVRWGCAAGRGQGARSWGLLSDRVRDAAFPRTLGNRGIDAAEGTAVKRFRGVAPWHPPVAARVRRTGTGDDHSHHGHHVAAIQSPMVSATSWLSLHESSSAGANVQDSPTRRLPCSTMLGVSLPSRTSATAFSQTPELWFCAPVGRHATIATPQIDGRERSRISGAHAGRRHCRFLSLPARRRRSAEREPSALWPEEPHA